LCGARVHVGIMNYEWAVRSVQDGGAASRHAGVHEC
jgi:hypothetical protein